MSTTVQEFDATEGHVDAFYYPGEEMDVVTFPPTATDRLLDAIEQERAERAWELSKFTDAEIKAEYEARFSV